MLQMVIYKLTYGSGVDDVRMPESNILWLSMSKPINTGAGVIRRNKIINVFIIMQRVKRFKQFLTRLGKQCQCKKHKDCEIRTVKRNQVRN